MDADRTVATLPTVQNAHAFLSTIRACEGTTGPDGYRALFGYLPTRGGPLFDSFADHPNVRSSFTQTDGTVGFTTAAGAYQIIFSTWTRLQGLLKLPDFSPASQDAAATQLIVERGALPDVMLGRLDVALGKCWPVWASLPGSTYAQPSRSVAFAQGAFTDAGGTLA